MPELTRARLVRSGLLFLVMYVALSGAFIGYGDRIASAVAPALATCVNVVQGDFRVLEARVEKNKLALKSELAVDGIVGARAGGRVITMRVAYATLAVTPVLAIALAVAFPQRSRRAKLATLLALVPILALLTSFHIASVLRSALIAQILRRAPTFVTFAMENGGVQVLALVGAALALALGELTVARGVPLVSGWLGRSAQAAVLPTAAEQAALPAPDGALPAPAEGPRTKRVKPGRRDKR